MSISLEGGGGCAAPSIMLTFSHFRLDSFYKPGRTHSSLIAVLTATHGYFAGLLFSGKFNQSHDIVEALLTFVAFCLISSAGLAALNR